MTLKTQPRFKSTSGLAYIKCGHGPAVVLVHGVGLCAEAWFQQTAILSHNHTVYAVDMPGHGDSDLLDSDDAGLAEYANAISQLVEYEIKTPVIIMGHSMGAMIAIQFASHYPKLCLGALALNSIYRRSKQARVAVQQRAQRMLDNPELDRVSQPILRWFGQEPQGKELEMAELCAGWLNQASPLGYAKAYGIFSRNDGPTDSELLSIKVPMAFITGDMDSNSSAEMSRKMALLAPQGSFHLISKSRHMAQITHPEEVNHLLLGFVSKCQQEKQELIREF